ncbi:hypothetical protein CAPTEDRAFT_185012 [Capitella teleta]|uniref:Uncharacterized protein n=1 Tax=Capitella teleta TaxID=283909 RepID=R7T5F3_CAPTE|nr:hypothetical protein CAPTEDRAFT_185012 [Capitella teleta]|eukprot:ELT88569.1 hypothetical protein CAPTEDRAFT_185012 [Capitella teleta]
MPPATCMALLTTTLFHPSLATKNGHSDLFAPKFTIPSTLINIFILPDTPTKPPPTPPTTDIPSCYLQKKSIHPQPVFMKWDIAVGEAAFYETHRLTRFHKRGPFDMNTIEESSSGARGAVDVKQYCRPGSASTNAPLLCHCIMHGGIITMVVLIHVQAYNRS